MFSYIFIGPTIQKEEASRYFRANYLPPVACGDIQKILKKKPVSIGIIDGLFGHVPSVFHKEILYALHSGIRVYGASSMGALRAAELKKYGMIGIGSIFDEFEQGNLVDDDEVALIHGPEELGFKPISIPMVNIRYILQKAHEANILESRDLNELLIYSKSLYYPKRSWNCIIEHCKKLSIPFIELDDYIKKCGLDLKKQDAIKMLKRMAEDEKKQIIADGKNFEFSDTQWWKKLQTENN